MWVGRLSSPSGYGMRRGPGRRNPLPPRGPLCYAEPPFGPPRDRLLRTPRRRKSTGGGVVRGLRGGSSRQPLRQAGPRRERVRVADVVAEILKREGVEVLIGYPVNPLIEAAAEANIRTLIVRQERTGIHMADAMSRMTSGKTLGVFAMQYGPGTENSFGGGAQAYADSVPVLIQPAGFERHLINVPPNFNAFLNYRNIVKCIEQLAAPKQVENVFRRAFTQLKNGRPRPVLVEIPW